MDSFLRELLSFELQEFKESIVKIVSKIYDDKLTIYFRPLEKSSHFTLSRNLIELGSLNRSNPLHLIWSILHEYGHFLDKNYDGPIFEIVEWRRENKAWENAYKELLNYTDLMIHENSFKNMREFSLDSYRKKHLRKNFNLTDRERKEVRVSFSNITKLLGNHEQKPWYKTRMSCDRYYRIIIDGRHFVIVDTKPFRDILENVFIEATEKYPNSFGQNQPLLILESFQGIIKHDNQNDLIRFLSKEQFAYIFEIKDEQVIGDVLRVDLFRKFGIDKNHGCRAEFTGGVLHAFKHFSYKGVPLSTHNSTNEIIHPALILKHLIRGFFLNREKSEDCLHSNVRKSTIAMDEKYMLTFVFYFENISKTYFVKTIIKKKIVIENQ